MHVVTLKTLLIWTSQESHLHPCQSSYRSQDQLHQQLFVDIKCMAHLENTITCCWENTGQDGQESTTNYQRVSLQWIRSCWKTGVSVRSQVRLTSTWAERLLYKKEVLDPDGAPYSSTEVCCWSHGQRKKPSGRKLCGHMKQKLTCFVTMSSNMSGEEKVRPSTQEHRYPILKTAMWGEGIFNQILELLYVYLWSSRFGHIFRRCILNKLLNQTAWMFLWQSSLHVLLILS